MKLAETESGDVEYIYIGCSWLNIAWLIILTGANDVDVLSVAYLRLSQLCLMHIIVSTPSTRPLLHVHNW